MESVDFLRRDRNDLDFTEVHGLANAADVRRNDRVRARMRKRSSNDELRTLPVWKLSPLGVELVSDDERTAYEPGDLVDLELTVAGQRSLFEGLVVAAKKRGADVTLVGVRFSKKIQERGGEEDRRYSTRWLCSDEFMPTAISPTPGRFDDYMYFQVRDISAEGVQLSCSLRNKFLIPGMKLLLTTSFPLGSVVQLNVEIVRIAIKTLGTRDRLIVGTRFVSLNNSAKETLAQYLIQFADTEDFEQLRSQGFRPKQVALGVDFVNLKTEQEYLQVLDLRFKAHEADGNLAEGASPKDLADIHDSRSRIVVGKYRGVPVATARVRFGSLDEKLEHEEFVEWPSDLPRRDQVVEISRVAILPGYRKADLLGALMRYAGFNALHPDKPWLVISCLGHMKKFYLKLGFKDTGLTHTEEVWKEDRILSIMIANSYSLALGRDVNPFYWNLMWKNVAESLIEQGSVVPTGLDRVRLFLFKVLSPFNELRTPKVKKQKTDERRS